MDMKGFRKAGQLTQSMLAQTSGVNFRSLQDYEQGHKPLRSASGDVLLRLSTALGCSVEELLLSDEIKAAGSPLLPGNTIPAEEINGRTFMCRLYGVQGKWVCSDGYIAVLFYYEGCRYLLPFRAIFKSELVRWLKEAAVMMMEEAIEETRFGQLAAR